MKRRVFSLLLAMSMTATSFQGLGITANAAEVSVETEELASAVEEATEEALPEEDSESKEVEDAVEELEITEEDEALAAAELSDEVLEQITAFALADEEVPEKTYADFTENEMVADLNFGADVTKDTVYSQEGGMGFSTVTFNEAAKDWVNNVYYPREATLLKSDASYVGEAKDSLEIKSKVWTETEKTGYGVYTYENTSSFDYDLLNADYEVEVTFVNPTSASYTAYVESEDITKVTDISVEAGKEVTKKFTAVVIDGQLNLKFLANSDAKSFDAAAEKSVYVSHVTLTRLATEEAGAKPTLFLASDSTVQTYEDYYKPQTGWGQVFHNFFGDFVEEREATNCTFYQSQVYEATNAIVENRAIGGRSVKSYIEEGKLDDILEDVKPGDFLLVQFGHNDATASRPNRYVATSDFAKWLQVYIDGALERGVTPILVTPCARYSLNGDGTFKSDFAGYGQVMKQVAEANQIPLVDLTSRSIALCNDMGAAGAESIFLHVPAGMYEGNYAKGATDNTHLQHYGAYKFAQCVAKGLAEGCDNSSVISDELKEKVAGLASLINVTTATAKPPKVSNIKAEAVSSFEIALSWDKNVESEFYDVYRAKLEAGQTIDDVDFSNAKRFAMTTNGSFKDATVESGVTYVYAVAGKNDLGLSEISEKVSAQTKAVDYAFDFNYDSATLAGWTGVNYNMAYDAKKGYGFKVLPGNGRNRSGNGSESSSAMSDDFALGTLDFAVDLPNGDYEVTIYSGDLLSGTAATSDFLLEGNKVDTIATKASLGSQTEVVRIADGQLNVSSTAAVYLNGLTITTLALAPSGLIAKEASVNGSNFEFLLSYKGLESAKGYKVFKKDLDADAEFKLVKEYTVEEYAADELGCNSMAVVVGGNYEFYIVAYFEDGSESAPSNILSLEAIIDGPKAAAPTNLHAVGLDESSETFYKTLTLEWDEVVSDKYPVIKYLVYRKAPKADKFELIGKTKTASFTDNDVNTIYQYEYKVSAYTATGEGELSEAYTTPKVGKYVAANLEQLKDRGLVAVNLSGKKGAATSLTATDMDGKELTKGVYLSWRAFDEDFSAGKLATRFTVYCNGNVIAKDIKVTNLVYEAGKASDVFKVVGSNDASVHGGLNVVDTTPWDNFYQEFKLFAPADQALPSGKTAHYYSNDLSVGDIDGDGVLELIVKWYPDNAKDNSQGGYTGTTIIDAYEVDWATGAASLVTRTNLGINIRSGAHYVQYQVWDYDGDGKAEMAVKTADGSTTYVSADGTDQTLTEVCHVGEVSDSQLRTDIINDKFDYRNDSGKILDGPEYFSVFNLEDGTKAAEDVIYTTSRGSVSSWGDSNGNRGDRFLAGTAYLNGETPFAIFCRGYYARTTLTAYYLLDTDNDGIGDTTDIYWNFDSNVAGSQYGGQGNHQISVNDVDGDGLDEIIYGGLVIDNDGTVLYNTKLGHGDALHVSDWVEENPGLEIFKVGEEVGAKYQVEMLDAATGTPLAAYFVGLDTGRGVAADIDPTAKGAEFWATAGPNGTGDYKNAWNSIDGNVYSTASTIDNLVELSHRSSPSANFSIFWDGDLLSEIQDHTFNEPDYVPIGVNLYKWNYDTNKQECIFYSEEIFSNNGTKGNMGLVADVLGDWREEILTRSSTNDNMLRIYTTTIETDYVIPCLLEDLAYREGVAWQNTAYNQPANTSYRPSQGLVTAALSQADKTEEQVTIEWTAACDGTLFGHDIEGYEIYKKDMLADGDDYKLIATVAADVLSFTDTDFDIDGQYGYRVAAVVNGRSSFKSAPLYVFKDMVDSVVTPEDIVVAVGTDIVLPETVAVKYKSGKIVDEKVTWNPAKVASINNKKENTLVIDGITESKQSVEVKVVVKLPTGDVIGKFDFGISSGNVESGWTGVTVNKKKGKTKVKDLKVEYTKEKGWGFTDGNAVIEGREESYNPADIDVPVKVYKDFCLPDGQTFVVDVPNGSYKVDIYTGSIYKSSVNVMVEDVHFTGDNGPTSATKITNDVDVTDGQLTFTFATGVTHRIDAIVITSIAAAAVDKHELVLVEGKAATCTEGGQIDYYYCEDCGSYYKDAEGTEEIYYYETFTDAKGHTAAEAVVENEVAATCANKGSYELVTYCKDCGVELSREVVETGKTAHTLKTVVVAASTKKDGHIDSKCSVCGEVVKSTPIKQIGSITLDEYHFVYDKKAHQPKALVNDVYGKKLVEGVDYTVSYSGNGVNKGAYTATIKFKGNYTGTDTKVYYVESPAVKAVADKVVPVIEKVTSTIRSIFNKIFR